MAWYWKSTWFACAYDAFFAGLFLAAGGGVCVWGVRGVSRAWAAVATREDAANCERQWSYESASRFGRPGRVGCLTMLGCRETSSAKGRRYLASRRYCEPATGKTRRACTNCERTLDSRATHSHDAVAGRAPQRAEELRARAVVGRVVAPGCFSPSR